MKSCPEKIENNALLQSVQIRGALTRKSAAVTAFLLFVIVNAICWPILRAQPDADGMAATTHAFVEQTKPAAIVFLGSSVAKRVFLGFTPTEKETKHIATLAFNLQLLSDSFILANEFLKGSKQPKFLVICVTPRDLNDNDVPDSIRTKTFRRTVTFFQIPFYASVLGLNLGDQCRAAYNYLCCLYDGRAGAQEFLGSSAKAVYTNLSRTKEQNNSYTAKPWSRSLHEYSWRYTGISGTTLPSRIPVLSKCLELCHRRGIGVLLVNLPVSKDNLNLLPAGFYKQYCDQLSEQARINNVGFVDFSRSADFTNADFEDCVHLNALGAQKVLRVLRPMIEQYSQADITKKLTAGGGLPKNTSL